MKRLILFTMLIALGMNDSNAQVFTHTYGEPGEFNSSRAVIETKDSNFAFVGSTAGWGAVNGDMLLVKTDTSGTMLWNRVYGNEATEEGVSLISLNDNGFVLLGITNESPDGDYDLRIIRTNDIGDTIWTRTLGTSSWDIPEEVIALSDGGFLIAANTYAAPHANGTFYLIKLDANGQSVWEHQLNRGFSAQVHGVLEMPDGTIMAGGAGTQTGATQNDFLLCKYSALGDTVWTKYYGGAQEEWIADIALSADLRICLAGNKTQVEGNTREFLITVDENGAILNTNDFDSERIIEMQSVYYCDFNNSFVFSGDYTSFSLKRASTFRYTVLLDYLCNLSISDLGSSNATDAISTHNGYMLMTGNYNTIGPGVSSVFVLKSHMDCSFQNTIDVGLADLEETGSSRVYPNPSQGTFAIELTTAPKSIQLNDVQGRSISIETVYTNGKLSVHTSAIAPGLYVLSIRTMDNRISNHRIMIAQ